MMSLYKIADHLADITRSMPDLTYFLIDDAKLVLGSRLWRSYHLPQKDATDTCQLLQRL